MLYGKTTRNPASRFLAELPAECVCEQNPGRKSQFSGRGRPGFGSDFESRQFDKVNSFLERQFQAEAAARKNTAVPKSDASTSDGGEYLSDFTVGQRVSHKKFGVGTVSKILGAGMNKTVEIQFDECGMKRLIIAYAKLRKA